MIGTSYHAKKWLITCPNKEEQIIINLAKFQKDNNIKTLTPGIKNRQGYLAIKIN